MQTALPDFIIIGAQKCGTTWLWNEIRKHPDIFTPKQKELSYFSNQNRLKSNDESSIQWYKEFFKNALPEQIKGEATPCYLFREWSAEKIHQVIADVKLIIILRQPADRAYSQWRMMRKNKTINDKITFKECFYGDSIKSQETRERGKYHKQIKRYQSYFKPAQLLILIYDELLSDYDFFLKKTYDFLNIRNNFRSETASEFILPRVPHLTDVPTQINTLDKQEITEYYHDSICKLETLLNCSLPEWKNKPFRKSST